MKDLSQNATSPAKFQDPQITADGSPRASVALTRPDTIWFNTGTLCNIACTHCYIESSPTNDALVYLTAAEVQGYLDEIADLGWPVQEIGFTGGEPFMNPQMIDMARVALKAGFRVLILTNAMQPMMRPRVQAGLKSLQAEFGGALTLRISLDHPDPANHDEERGAGSFARSIDGMKWLRDAGIAMAVAGRSLWGGTEAQTRAGFAALYAEHGFDIDPRDPGQTVIFPEMDETADVPEITTACWGILDKSPGDVMCATSRMVVKHRGAAAPSVVACTLLPHAPDFDLGPTLKGAAGKVHLNHPHCAKFCVLGGASCSA